MLTIIISFAALIICICLSAFFSGSEMAYSSANTVRLENLSEKGDKKAKRALYITDRFDLALSAILIGNNLVNIASSSLGSVLVILILGSDSYAWISTVVVTILIIIFGETIPKIKCKKNATSISLKYSYPVRVLMFVLKPIIIIVVKLVDLLSKPFKEEVDEEDENEEQVEELQSIIETAEDEGVLDEDDSEILQNAIEFPDVSASEVMTARVDVWAIDIDDPKEEIIDYVIRSPYSRIPVYKDSTDNVIGVVHVNQIMQMLADEDREFDLTSIMMKPCYVYKTMKMPTVLNELKKAKQHLAIVTDEYSGTLGVLTMEDVMEQLVGEIWDETDIIEDEVVQKNDKEFEIDGDLPISEFLELVGLDEDNFEFESETVGGWAVEILEKFPDDGDSFEYENLNVKVLKVDVRRVEKLLITFK